MTIWEVILLISSLTLAFTNIYTFFIKKPVAAAKGKIDKEFSEKFDEECARKQNDPNDPLMQKIDYLVNNSAKRNEQFALLSEGFKDILREKIMDIYYHYKDEKKLPMYVKEPLEVYYKDYKA